MGIKASFWIGNPANPNLGRSNCIAMKLMFGTPCTHTGRRVSFNFFDVKTKKQFKRELHKLYNRSQHTSYFWHYPILPINGRRESSDEDHIYWNRYLPLEVDYTYAWFNDRLNIQKFDMEWKIWGDNSPWIEHTADINGGHPPPPEMMPNFGTANSTIYPDSSSTQYINSNASSTTTYNEDDIG